MPWPSSAMAMSATLMWVAVLLFSRIDETALASVMPVGAAFGPVSGAAKTQSCG